MKLTASFTPPDVNDRFTMTTTIPDKCITMWVMNTKLPHPRWQQVGTGEGLRNFYAKGMGIISMTAEDDKPIELILQGPDGLKYCIDIPSSLKDTLLSLVKDIVGYFKLAKMALIYRGKNYLNFKFE